MIFKTFFIVKKSVAHITVYFFSFLTRWRLLTSLTTKMFAFFLIWFITCFAIIYATKSCSQRGNHVVMFVVIQQVNLIFSIFIFSIQFSAFATIFKNSDVEVFQVLLKLLKLFNTRSLCWNNDA